MRTVPFFANTKDDYHCYQASLRMVLKYFIPRKNFTYKQLDRLTNQKKGFWTWPMRGVLSLQSMGFDIVDIEEFDYAKVADNAKQYLVEVYGKEAGAKQIHHSDIPAIEEDAKEFVRRVKTDYRLPEFNDIQRLLHSGYLVVCLINSKILNRNKGYTGHFVVIYRCTDKIVTVHDSGLPPRRNRRITRRIFEQAWKYPDRRAKNILAFKL